MKIFICNSMLLATICFSVFTPAFAQTQTHTPAVSKTTAAAPTKTLSALELITLLKKGGYVLLIRHERTEVPSRDDDYSKPASDCMVQRNLSVAGHAGAIETGKVIAALNIPIGRVLSSPMCRTMDTARLAFGKAEPEKRLIHHDDKTGRSIEIAVADMKAVVQALPLSEDNIVIVSHFVNISRPYGLNLSEGEIGIIKRDAKGGFQAIGQVMGSDFAPHARAELAKAK